jgi:hypothetical protein
LVVSEALLLETKSRRKFAQSRRSLARIGSLSDGHVDVVHTKSRMFRPIAACDAESGWIRAGHAQQPAAMRAEMSGSMPMQQFLSDAVFSRAQGGTVRHAQNPLQLAVAAS